MLLVLLDIVAMTTVYNFKRKKYFFNSQCFVQEYYCFLMTYGVTFKNQAIFAHGYLIFEALATHVDLLCYFISVVLKPKWED